MKTLELKDRLDVAKESMTGGQSEETVMNEARKIRRI